MTSRSEEPLSDRRHRSSGLRMMPERPSRSPAAVASTPRRSPQRNPVKVAVKSVAGVFVSCFTPPECETVSSKKSGQRHVISEIPRNKGKKKPGSPRGRIANLYKPGDMERLSFSMADIYKATNNFSPSLKIGQGGFGIVYKGTLDDGTLVAVKRAKKVDYGNNSGVEFQSEIRTLAQVEHRNLVKFYGFVEEEDERILVVEYVPNGTLRQHLDCVHGDVLGMAARLDIAIDVAHAITYLHTYLDHPIIHRDIKSSNILLTKNHVAKVADFGFARLAPESGSSHVSTQIKGTAGYLDPEYLKSYQLTDKSDVYSFGVLLVELVTGRRPIEMKCIAKERVTARWAIIKFTEGDAISTMDPRLEKTAANTVALEKVLELGLICLCPQRQNRPSMKRCAEILWSIRKDYQQLSAKQSASFSSLSRRRELSDSETGLFSSPSGRSSSIREDE